MCLAVDCREWMAPKVLAEALLRVQGFHSPRSAMPEASEPIEVQLLREIARGDAQAFTKFDDQFSALLFTLALRILNDPKEAEDVVQFKRSFCKSGKEPRNLTPPWANRPAGSSLLRAIGRLTGCGLRRGVSA